MWHIRSQSWIAQVTRSKKCGLDGKNQHLGYHQDERAAAMAVDSFVRLFMPTMAQQKANFPTLEKLHESKLEVTPANDLKRRDRVRRSRLRCG